MNRLFILCCAAVLLTFHGCLATQNRNPYARAVVHHKTGAPVQSSTIAAVCTCTDGMFLNGARAKFCACVKGIELKRLFELDSVY